MDNYMEPMGGDLDVVQRALFYIKTTTLILTVKAYYCSSTVVILDTF